VYNACLSEQMFGARPAVSRTPQVLFRGASVPCAAGRTGGFALRSTETPVLSGQLNQRQS